MSVVLCHALRTTVNGGIGQRISLASQRTTPVKVAITHYERHEEHPCPTSLFAASDNNRDDSATHAEEIVPFACSHVGWSKIPSLPWSGTSLDGFTL